MKVTSMPADERPREKLARFGPGVLGDAELVALLLGSGTKGKNALELSREVLETFGGLEGLCQSSLAGIKTIPGIGEGKAAVLSAVGEILRRVMVGSKGGKASLFDVAEGFRKKRYECEECHLLFLDGRGKVEGMSLLCRGNQGRIDVSPEQILRLALRQGATRFVLLHVHPSGIPLPSGEDIALTLETLRRCQGLRLCFHDHLIVSSEGIYSFKEQGNMRL